MSVTSSALSARRQPPVALWAILVLALALRLAFVLFGASAAIGGGDTPFLMLTGPALLSGQLTGSPATGPVYLIFTGVVQWFFHGDTALLAIRLINVLIGVALCAFSYVIGTAYAGKAVGLLTALLLAVTPVFVIEAGNVLTESVFLLFLFGALALYARWHAVPLADVPGAGWLFIGIGILLGLATLTRAIVILLPVVLIIDLLQRRRAALRLIGALLISYVVVVGAWSVYSTLRWGEFVIGAQGLAANVYLGTTTWCGPTCVDQQAGITTNSSDNQNKFMQGAFDTIRADPLGYVRHRLANVIDAELQPYNTVIFPGESIKAIVGDWWAQGHPLSALGQITQSDNFWPKLALYLFHYLALIGGVIGLLLSLRRLGWWLLLFGVIGYFLTVHSVLMAIPRYLLPLEPLWLLFTAYTLIWLWKRLRRVRAPSVVMEERE